MVAKRDKYVLFSRVLGKMVKQVDNTDPTAAWTMQVNGLVFRTMAEAGDDYFDFIDSVLLHPTTSAERVVSMQVKQLLK